MKILNTKLPRWKNLEKKCSDCGIIICNIATYCRSCMFKGKRSPLWGKFGSEHPMWKANKPRPSRRLDKRCLDCGKQIDDRATYCKSCNFKGERNPQWVAGNYAKPKPRNYKKLGKKCPDCGKPINDRSTICLDCMLNSDRNPFRTLDVKGKANPFYGKTHSKETRAKLRQLNLGKSGLKGPENPAWKGGKAKLICDNCGKEFERWPSSIKGLEKDYCSRACQIEAFEPPRGPEHWNWQGGRRDNGRGYILIYDPGNPMADRHGYVLEHRKIMAEIIGRPLLPNEIVHHKNRVRSDNRPRNLQLFSSHGDHLQDHILKGHLF